VVVSVLTLPDALPEVLPDAPPETEPLEFTFVSVLPEVDVEPPVSSPLEICAAAGPTPTMSAASAAPATTTSAANKTTATEAKYRFILILLCTLRMIGSPALVKCRRCTTDCTEGISYRGVLLCSTDGLVAIRAVARPITQASQHDFIELHFSDCAPLKPYDPAAALPLVYARPICSETALG
jgi:hypothetical protein